ncbi:hypothetical protein K7640_01120 [Micromonospora sp. PLK6-60]|uniref:hypothetical protein n=1 Tax=Micromonospora sp. PLK6-60 TaxID=2873383 RepID=UPI001CA6D5CB|nr:hypothetical protein [Micromonospora sp. PLK6-60]MBY8870441.1 hypothetical protein [Micromonospora sp. PLK6-60]
MPVTAAFPYIEVRIVPPAPPLAQRSPGVVAVVGKAPANADGGAAAANTPVRIETLDDAVTNFARRNAGNVVRNALYNSLELALSQDPRPAKVYGVKVSGDDYAAALGGLEAADDVTMVSLANEATVGNPAAGANPPTGLHALKAHVESMSAAGQARIGFAMTDPAATKSPTYVADTVAAVAGLKSSTSRMMMVAARGVDGDAATAAMAAVAGLPVHYSIVLKKVRGLAVPIARQYSPAEIKGLSEADIVPLIDPDMIVGESLHFADGRLFTTDASLMYVDLVRTLDQIKFMLRAGLIGLIGDARITKPGMTLLKTQVEGILGPLKRSAVIDDYTVQIPVLDILSLPESARDTTDNAIVTAARADRTVDLVVTVTYGPAVSRLLVTLVAKF